MEPSVSPLPLPLWPMLALSLALFGLTIIAVTISGHYTRHFYADYGQNTPEVAAPTLVVAPHRNSRPIF